MNADDQIGSTSEWKSRYKREDGEYKPQSKVCLTTIIIIYSSISNERWNFLVFCRATRCNNSTWCNNSTLLIDWLPNCLSCDTWCCQPFVRGYPTKAGLFLVNYFLCLEHELKYLVYLFLLEKRKYAIFSTKTKTPDNILGIPGRV